MLVWLTTICRTWGASGVGRLSGRIQSTLLLLLMASATASPLPPLQPLLDAAAPRAILKLAPGCYAGPAVIRKPLTLDGQGQACIDNGGRGTVLTVQAADVSVRGLRLTGSGESFDTMDAGILVDTADRVRIENNRIDTVLFGIHLKAANDAVVHGNTVRGQAAPLNLRGDAIRIWYGRGNRIEANDIAHLRDITLTNAPANQIRNNRIRHGRYAVHLVFSPDNIVAANDIAHTTTGIVVLYSDRVRVEDNRIHHVRAEAGAALAFKETSDTQVQRNEVLHCAVGLQANSPLHGHDTLLIEGNRFAHNDTALYFYGDKGGHVLRHNRFEKNLSTLAVSHANATRGHLWEDNAWDDYEGFDRNGDGIGDTPHELWLYADRIWMETPKARFFRNTPALELLDFLERLAPFSAPERLLQDPRPRLLTSPSGKHP